LDVENPAKVTFNIQHLDDSFVAPLCCAANVLFFIGGIHATTSTYFTSTCFVPAIQGIPDQALFTV